MGQRAARCSPEELPARGSLVLPSGTPALIQALRRTAPDTEPGAAARPSPWGLGVRPGALLASAPSPCSPSDSSPGSPSSFPERLPGRRAISRGTSQLESPGG